MRKITILTFIVSVLTSYSALAGDKACPCPPKSLDHPSGTSDTSSSSGAPGVVGETPSAGTSTTTTADVGPQGLGEELIGIKPQAGAINFRDSNGTLNNRGAIGFTLEMNAMRIGGMKDMLGLESGSGLYVGPQTGFFFSHLGTTGGTSGNFVGASSDNVGGVGSTGANLFMIPANLKAGWSFGPFRAAVHGGGNLFYRSVTNSVALGSEPDLTAGDTSSWNMLPNAGADLEYGFTNQIAVILRPDVTFGSENRLWMATLGLSIPIG